MLQRLLLVTISSLLALALAELATHVFVPPQPTIRFQQDVGELEGLDLREAARMIENHPDFFWRLAPNTRLPDEAWPFFGLISNGQSLREEHEIPLAKPVGQTRILFLGDSCTFGYGVALGQTFVEVLESMLEEQHSSPFECINAGVPGYTVFQGYRYLLAGGLAFQPDLVVLNFGWNDGGEWDHLGDREHHALLKAAQPPGLLAKSRLLQALWRSGNKPASSQGDLPARPRLLPSEFRETLDEIHDLLAGRGIPLLVLVWPMRANTDPGLPPEARTALQVEMVRFGQDHPLPTVPPVDGALDLVPLARTLVGEHGIHAIYLDHGHVTPVAHRAFAAAIADHLSPWLSKE